MCHQMYQGTIFQPFSGVLSRMPYNYFLVEQKPISFKVPELLRREAIVENETVWIDSPFTGLGGCFAHRVVNDFAPRLRGRGVCFDSHRVKIIPPAP